MKSKQKELSDPICGLSVGEWVMELAEEPRTGRGWAEGGLGVHRSRTYRTTAKFLSHKNEWILVHETLPIALSSHWCTYAPQANCQPVGKTWLALPRLSERRQAPHTSEADPRRILTFSFRTGPGSVSTHRFLRFAAKHTVGTCYCHRLKKAGSFGSAGTPAEMEALARAGGEWVRSVDLTLRACVGSSGSSHSSGKVSGWTWSDGGQGM